MARMQSQVVQQSLLHQQSKRCPPTERTERTESSCREEPPTDGTDQHRSFVGWYGILPYPRTHILEIVSHRCKLRGCSSLCCTNKANGILPQNARNAQNLLAEKSLPQMQSQGVQQSLLHQQSKRCPPTDSTDLHRCRRVWHPAVPTQSLTQPNLELSMLKSKCFDHYFHFKL